MRAPTAAAMRGRPASTRGRMPLPPLDSAQCAVIDASAEAALDAGRWPEVLRRLTDASGGIGGLFVGVSFDDPARGFFVHSGLDQVLTERFMTVHQDNRWSRRLMRVPAGQAIDVQAGSQPARAAATSAGRSSAAALSSTPFTKRWPSVPPKLLASSTASLMTTRYGIWTQCSSS